MPVIAGTDYSDSFGGVSFLAGQNQAQARKTEYADEVIVGGAVTGTSYVYRDHYALPPDTLDLDILVPDRATFEALAALRGYPFDAGGVPYELVIPAQAIDWTASLDELTSNGAYLDTPLRCHAVFTKIADLGGSGGGGVTPATPPTTAPTAGYVAGVSGLDVEIDPNQGTASAEDLIDDYWIEWGDGSPSEHITGGPWRISAAELPVTPHTYGAPSPTPADYVVEITVYRNGVASDPFATVVTV